jgi:hypothetical protein
MVIVPQETQSPIERVVDDIEAKLWLAARYYEQGATGLGNECLRDAWRRYSLFSTTIRSFSAKGICEGAGLGDRLRAAIVERCPQILERARGETSEAEGAAR